jgi:predicted AAA+ superfamily ATPase
MTLTPQGYKKRLIDDVLPEYLEAFGAVVIEGPKFCGKTWTALHHAKSVFYVADPTDGFKNRLLANHNPSVALLGDTPRVLDEWQQAPGLWDAVRFDVDKGAGKGRYLLTGSATPIDGATIHSGAGRIARLTMRPMSLFESGDSTGQISLKSIIEQEDIPTVAGTFTIEALSNIMIRGGWPENLDLPLRVSQKLATQYLFTIAQSDISSIDNKLRNPSKVMALLQSLARNNAQTASYATIQKDIILHTVGESLSEKSVMEYIGLLKRLFVIEEVRGWSPHITSSAKLRSNPKRMFIDPSLALAGMDANADALIADTTTTGSVFESLVIRDLLIYLQLYDAQLYYYRDNSGLEVDVIVSWSAYKWGAFEIKLSAMREDQAAKSLKRLEKKMTASGVAEPMFLGIITGLGGIAKKRSDGIYTIPIDCLRP